MGIKRKVSGACSAEFLHWLGDARGIFFGKRRASRLGSPAQWVSVFFGS